MNTIERIKMLKAMEYIVRQVNDEALWFDHWAYEVADGDIEYGDLSVNPDDADILEYYIDDEEFPQVMGLFTRLMARAWNGAGLYCDGIVSDTKHKEE